MRRAVFTISSWNQGGIVFLRSCSRCQRRNRATRRPSSSAKPAMPTSQVPISQACQPIRGAAALDGSPRSPGGAGSAADREAGEAGTPSGEAASVSRLSPVCPPSIVTILGWAQGSERDTKLVGSAQVGGISSLSSTSSHNA